MAAPTTQQRPIGVQPSRGRSSWNNRLQGVTLAAALLALDLLPFYALLLVAAGYVAGDVGRVALPLPYLAAAGVIFTMIGWLLRKLPLGVSILAGGVVGLCLLIVAIAISPAGYGEELGGLLTGAWMNPFASDLAAGASIVHAFFGLGLVVLVIGFRGVALGREPPELESVLKAFGVSVAAIVLAAIFATPLPGDTRLPAEATLGFLLPLDVFAALLASALTRAALNRQELRGADPRTAGGERWLAMAIILSGIVVVVTLIVSSIVTFGSISAALRQLGPVGAALDAALRWTIEGFAWVLFFLFGPLIAWLKQQTSQLPPMPTQAPQAQQTPTASPALPLPEQFVNIAAIVLVILGTLLLILVVILMLRLLLGARRRRLSDGIEEERESLDGAALLQAQLRALLDRFRRRPGESETEEPLPPGSIRALYRDLLRAAESHGIGRRDPETPDEYSHRLGTTLRATGREGELPADISTLGEAYGAARYGEHEPGESDRVTLRDQAGRVLHALRRRAP